MIASFVGLIKKALIVFSISTSCLAFVTNFSLGDLG
jgi:hypothetical protein